MKFSIKIFSVFGIPVELHISFILLILAIYVVAFFNFIPGINKFIAVLITLVFVTVVIHELAHSYVAKGYGVNIERIVLLPIGGVSAMSEIPKNPDEEFRISIAGPLTNFVIAAIFFVVSLSSGNQFSPDISWFIYYFAWVNLVLGAFNLLPAYPMDGGRVLRAFLAKRMSYIRATEMAATIGKLLAIIMAIIGIFINLFLILIALFIYIGAEQEYQAILISTLLEGINVQNIMTREVKTLSPDTTVTKALERMFREKHMGYPVTEEENLIGIVTFDDLSKISEEKKNIPIRDIMTRELVVSNPGEHVADALEKLSRNDIGRLPVKEGGKLVGIISKTDVMRALDMLKVQKSIIP